jgi:hypothetical protein
MSESNVDYVYRRNVEATVSREMGLIGLILAAVCDGAPCDVTFYDRLPAINVTFSPRLAQLCNPSSGPRVWQKHLNALRLSNGLTVTLKEIWSVYPMPKGGFTEEELAAVDMSLAEEPLTADGRTWRQMVRDTYHCTSREEEDLYLRRVIAS